MANLITIEEYKLAEGIQSAKEDLRLESIVPSVSQLVKTYCGNSILDFYSISKLETFNISWDTNIVQLTETPIRAVAAVSIRESYNQEYSFLDDNDQDYYIDFATDSIYRTYNNGNPRSWPRGPGAVRVQYTAGYSECPADLRLAVIDLITYYLRDEHKERKTIAGSSIQNQSSTSQRNNVAFPDHIKRVLDLYKNF